MFILCDVGNTSIEFAVCEGNNILRKFRIKTLVNRSSDEYIIMFKTLLGDVTFKDVLISSVVPVVTSALVKMFQKYYNIKVHVLGPGIKTGVMIKADNPREVGADLICDVAGSQCYGNDVIIIDLGTATKYIYQHNSTFMGISIAPGVVISMNALTNSAALLPSIELQTPKTVLCNNTISCMQSGVIYGAASQVDAMIDRIIDEIKVDNVKIVATGGLSGLIIPLCKHDIILDDELVLKGLLSIYNKNTK